jgi:putative transposase
VQFVDPPPHFRGLDPELPVAVHRRNLPHWRQRGATYFVTHRLADSLPEAQTEQLREEREHWLAQNPPPHNSDKLAEYAKWFSTKIERWLDAGSGSCLLRDGVNGALIARALQHFDDDRYHLFAYVVMPNHFHAIVKPLGDHDLDAIWESWKRFTARELTKRGARISPVWFREGYDRIVRDAGHLYRVVRYIGRNPRRAGLSKDQCPHGLHPDWQSAGWSLFDEQYPE